TSRTIRSTLSCFRISLQIPPGRNRCLETAVVFLSLVLKFDLREVQCKLIRWQVMRTVRATGLIRTYDKVFQRDYVKILLILALFADKQRGFFDVLARCAGQHKFGAG